MDNFNSSCGFVLSMSPQQSRLWPEYARIWNIPWIVRSSSRRCQTLRSEGRRPSLNLTASRRSSTLATISASLMGHLAYVLVMPRIESCVRWLHVNERSTFETRGPIAAPISMTIRRAGSTKGLALTLTEFDTRLHQQMDDVLAEVVAALPVANSGRPGDPSILAFAYNTVHSSCGRMPFSAHRGRDSNEDSGNHPDGAGGNRGSRDQHRCRQALAGKRSQQVLELRYPSMR